MTQRDSQDGGEAGLGGRGAPGSAASAAQTDQNDARSLHGQGAQSRPTGWALSPGMTAAVIAVLVLVTFWQTRGFQYLNWDDPKYVQNNPHVQNGLSLEGIRWAFEAELVSPSANSDYWLPVTHISHMLDVELFGPGPGPAHVMNAFYQGVAAALLFGFLWLATGLIGPSAFCAALFAVHPVHVESVAWITERKDVLGGVFWMSGLTLYCLWTRKGGWLRYAGVCAAFVLGQLSKPIFVVFPFVLVLADVWPLRRISTPALLTSDGRRSFGRLMIEKLPLFALALVACVLTVRAAGSAIADLESLSFKARLAHTATAYVSYARRLLLPIGLSPFHPPAAVPSLSDAAFCAFLLVAVTGVVLLASGRAPYLAVGWFWFLGVLFPVSGLVQVGPQQMADRFLYLPAVGIYAAVSWAAWHASQALPHRRRAVAVPVAAGVALTGLFVATQRYLPHWADSVAMWTRAIKVNARANGMAHLQLALALRQEGQLSRALPHFVKAARMLPARDFAQIELSKALTDAGKPAEALAALGGAVRTAPRSVPRLLALGDALFEAGETARARARYADVLGLEPENMQAHARMGGVIARTDGPAAGEAYLEEALDKHDAESVEISMALGGLALTSGNDEAAAEHFHKALSLSPSLAAAMANLGDLAAKRGETAEAIEWYRRSLDAQPDRVESHVNLGAVLLEAGRVTEAVVSYSFVVKRRPRWATARVNLSQALLALGDVGGTVEQYRAALELDPSLHNVRHDLGTVLARTGAFGEAREILERVIRDAPDMVEAHANLANVLEAQGHPEKALQSWQTALAKRPDWPPAVDAIKRLQTAVAPTRQTPPAP